MPTNGTAGPAVLRWLCALATSALLFTTLGAKADWDRPWRNEERALVIDAYEFNPINWNQMTGDKRIAGFINKASDGLPPNWSCRGLTGDDENLCKNRWWKYSVTQELYMTRREIAKMHGLKWGAYHLGRPGNPREQADHFIDFAKPEADDLIALDIEDNDPKAWMSLADAEIFARQIKIRLDRYPVLYTNGSTADYIARNKATYPLLSRLQLWYARYRDDITGVFPEGNWDAPALWQFSSMHNCSARSCPYRVAGAKNDIDVNVSPLTVAELKAAWPFDGLVGQDPAPVAPDAGTLVADAGREIGEAVSRVGQEVAAVLSPNEAQADTPPAGSTLAAAYGPTNHAPIDPLKLLTEAARQEHAQSARSPVLSALTQGPKTDPAMPADRSEPAGIATGGGALIDTLGQLRDEMRTVREILREGAETLGERAELLPGAKPARADLKSHILRLMQEAEAAVKSVPAHAADERASVRGGWTTLAGLSPIDRRVVSAFGATR